MKYVFVLLWTLLMAGIFLPCRTASAQLIGPHPYLSFSDSPFTGPTFSYFHLENWEDGNLSTPGVRVNGNSLRLSSTFGSAAIDSVDADDGTINGRSDNGAGHYGEALWGSGST